MRPVRPGAERAYAPGTLFVDGARHVFGDGFTTIRWILNFDKNGDWKARVRPTAAEVTHDDEPIPVGAGGDAGERDRPRPLPLDARQRHRRLPPQPGAPAPVRRRRRGAARTTRRADARRASRRSARTCASTSSGATRSGTGASASRRTTCARFARRWPPGRPRRKSSTTITRSPDHGATWLRWHALQTKRLADVFGDVFGARRDRAAGARPLRVPVQRLRRGPRRAG